MTEKERILLNKLVEEIACQAMRLCIRENLLEGNREIESKLRKWQEAINNGG